jgi:hypothetical protein
VYRVHYEQTVNPPPTSGTFMARSTPEMDAAASPVWHAAPADAATSSASSASRALALMPRCSAAG